MSDETLLNDLLIEYEIRRDQGVRVTPEELVPQDRTDLLTELKQRIARRDQAHAAFSPDTTAAFGESTTPPSDAGPAGAEPAAGRRYGRFVLQRFHAKGGMGEVFVALDQELDRPVALKRIRSEFQHHSVSRERFLREARITSKLEHPGIVPVHGMVTDQDGQPCYVMRYIEGETFEDAILRFHQSECPGRDPGERTLVERQLLQHFISLCQTIAYAHSRDPGAVDRAQPWKPPYSVAQ
jgi:hypothetical protein